MATLRNNGTEIGRIETLTKKYSYRSNGWILVNSGTGWKRHSKHENIDRVYREDLEVEANKPKLLVEFENHFKDLFPHGKRVMAKHVFDLLSDDPDGLCSELQDYVEPVCLEEVVKLCELWDTWQTWRVNEPHKVKQCNTIVAIFPNLEMAKAWAKAEAQVTGTRLRVSYAWKHEIVAYRLLGNEIYGR